MENEIQFILNNEDIVTNLHPGTVLLDFIRTHKKLVGTKNGCREGDCGACTVLVGRIEKEEFSYRPLASCLLPLGNVQGTHVVTIEGLNQDTLTPIQQAFVDEGGSQCGFCTVGFVMSITGFCLRTSEPTFQSALDAMGGNACRCTGYKSIERAADQIVSALSDLNSQNRVTRLIEQGILPNYFKVIPERLKALEKGAGEEPTIAKPSAMLIGGGTDLFVQHPEELVDENLHFLANQATLKGIHVENGHCMIGGLVTMETFRVSKVINDLFPDIMTDLKRVSTPLIRPMATIAGNLVNASPIADLAIILLALDSDLILNLHGAKRTVPLKAFYKGYKDLDLKPEEIVETIRFSMPGSHVLFNFEKVSKRSHQDIASVNSAMSLEIEDGTIKKAVISAGGVAPIPLVLEKASSALKNQSVGEKTIRQIAEMPSQEITPISDVRGSADYKRLLLRQLIYAHFAALFPAQIDLEALL